jgi:hypothetical protein
MKHATGKEAAGNEQIKITEKTASTEVAKEVSIDVRYDQAAKAYQLPDFAAIAIEFDLDLIEPDTKRLLRDVTKKMFDRIDAFRKVLETLLQPDMSVISMQEAERLEHTDTDRVGEILRRLMLLDRQLLLAELYNTDEAYAQFITLCASEWPSIKQEMTPILTKLAKGWSIKQPVKPRHTQYLG